jgi:UDP-N-acetylglucosamine 2-epimerase (non-hydrolysing)
MKTVISIVGARPNFMKAAPIHRAFKKYQKNVRHLLVHTGQHYDATMSDAFFKDLEMPQPDYFLGAGSGTHAEQTAKIMLEFEKVCNEVNPDLVLVVGDVNSTIACALTAVKLGIKVGHIEGGLRSFDRTMPEEINRIATDAICDYCFITEESALKNLLKENFPQENIFFVGNTMIDSQKYSLEKAQKSDIKIKLGVKQNEYVLITLHRPSNVDEPKQLSMLLSILNDLSRERKIIFPIHPRTLKNLHSYGFYQEIENNNNFVLTVPLGYLDFLNLMLTADFIMTDSGGIQEETTVLGIPCITLRCSTERPVTCELGTNILIKPENDKIVAAIDDMLNKQRKAGKIPPLWDGKAAERIADIIKNKIF